MIKSLRLRVKRWWDVWVFVIGFPLGLIFVFLFWNYLVKINTNPIWIIGVSVVFLYCAIILIVSTIIAISENNIFVSSFILLFIGVSIGVLGYFYTQQSVELDVNKLVSDYYANISTEFISVVITVLAIETLRERIHWRNYQREKINQESTSETPTSQTIVESTPENTLSINAQTPITDKKASYFVIALIIAVIGFFIGQFLQRDVRSTKEKLT